MNDLNCHENFGDIDKEMEQELNILNLKLNRCQSNLYNYDYTSEEIEERLLSMLNKSDMFQPNSKYIERVQMHCGMRPDWRKKIWNFLLEVYI